MVPRLVCSPKCDGSQDSGNHRIRRVDLTTKNVTTFAGSGTAGYLNGDGTSAQFNVPHNVAIDPSGTFALVAVRSWPPSRRALPRRHPHTLEKTAPRPSEMVTATAHHTTPVRTSLSVFPNVMHHRTPSPSLRVTVAASAVSTSPPRTLPRSPAAALLAPPTVLAPTPTSAAGWASKSTRVARSRSSRCLPP